MTASFSNTSPSLIVIPSEAKARPFDKITLSDTVVTSAENLTIALAGPISGVGTLSDPGGKFSLANVFTEVKIAGGTPSGVTSILANLDYAAPKIAAGTFALVSATITEKDANGVPASPQAFQLLEIVSAPAITVSNISSSVTSGTPISPFASGGVIVTDDDVLHDTKNSGTITLVDSAGKATDAQGTLNGPGLKKVGVGSYDMNATSTFSFNNNLQQLVFSPLAAAAGANLTTGFKLLVRDEATTLPTADNIVTSVQVNGLTSVLTAPLIAGTIASQSVAPGNAIHPFNAATISDSNANPKLSALLVVGDPDFTMGVGTLQGAGLQLISGGQPGGVLPPGGAPPNRYVLTAPSPEALTTALRNIVFIAPALAGHPLVTNTISLDVTDQGLSSSGATTVQEVADPPPVMANFLIANQSTGHHSASSGDPYPAGGPVQGLQHQLILVTPDNLNITATVPNSFIHSGSGTDAINVSAIGGNNVLDGSTGSNFLTGGSGRDTFYLDDRNPTSDVYSTVVNFHAGDNVTIFGVDAVNFSVITEDDQGAVGAKGLTYTFLAPGRPNASVVIAGYSRADLSNGRLSAGFGFNPDQPGQPGSGGTYLNIHGN